MSDLADGFDALAVRKKALRAKFGIPCPQCNVTQPARIPSILMPGQRCRIDGYLDRRPELTDAEWSSV